MIKAPCPSSSRGRSRERLGPVLWMALLLATSAAAQAPAADGGLDQDTLQRIQAQFMAALRAVKPDAMIEAAAH